MQEIKKLTTNGVSGLKHYEVGVNGVTEIRDCGVDEEHSFVVGFSVYVNEKCKYEYWNGVYEIEFLD